MAENSTASGTGAVVDVTFAYEMGALAFAVLLVLLGALVWLTNLQTVYHKT